MNDTQDRSGNITGSDVGRSKIACWAKAMDGFRQPPTSKKAYDSGFI